MMVESKRRVPPLKSKERREGGCGELDETMEWKKQ